MTRTHMVLLAALGSAAIIGAALVFQYVFGIAPCKLCIWQRWPHVIAAVLGPLALVSMGRSLPLAGLGTMLISTGLGGYHTGVERGWWPGPASCTSAGGGLGKMSGADLLSFDAAGPAVVLCDEVPWSLLGLSMATYNAAGSLVLAGIWLMALRLSAR
ncbi:disulfide bond formation protein DsbB [Rhodovulum imhoffii]|uniref:Disulfide bond formation protein DsbB n=1 Tax=Rhodovulum imhoffii TaxID=365340 RepID=A0A2T5BTU1_9RHOB|nr:disulfide bond formation protein B [Rhodovulum imhoffii]MBK5934147.1 disulfide bond formation protein B [Rhodovulum imhoffii]PTN02779.1 disulfide bond formation protein DsbB [Rhodovulum imhoffii]